MISTSQNKAITSRRDPDGTVKLQSNQSESNLLKEERKAVCEIQWQLSKNSYSYECLGLNEGDRFQQNNCSW